MQMYGSFVGFPSLSLCLVWGLVSFFNDPLMKLNLLHCLAALPQYVLYLKSLSPDGIPLVKL